MVHVKSHQNDAFLRESLGFVRYALIASGSVD